MYIVKYMYIDMYVYIYTAILYLLRLSIATCFLHAKHNSPPGNCYQQTFHSLHIVTQAFWRGNSIAIDLHVYIIAHLCISSQHSRHRRKPSQF